MVCYGMLRSLELPVQPYKSKPLLIKSISDNIYRSVHYTGEQPCRLTIIWLLSIFKAAVVKPFAHCKCTGNFYSLISPLSLHQMKQF